MSQYPAFSAELAPRDFRARFARRARGAGAAQAAVHRGRRALVLAAAVAVPAFAAPQEWQTFGLGAASTLAAPAGSAIEPMPFEQAGASFPGSAFYYLAPEDPAAGAPLAPGAHWDGQSFDGELLTGPAARGLRVGGSEIDRMRALTCLTQAVYYEAASEPDAGQRAVAQVVLNRVAHPAYPKTVCGVVYQGSEKSTGCQFTFTCDGALARIPNRLFWLRAESVARGALAGFVYAPVGLATHYHTIAVSPYWAPSLNYVGTIGAHRFYRFGGPAGAAATFNPAFYRGGEPVAAPAPRGTAIATDAPVDPVAIERAFAGGMKVATRAATATAAGAAALPAPAYAAALEARGGDALYTARALPGANAIRPEYANSGKWITQPGS